MSSYYIENLLRSLSFFILIALFVGVVYFIIKVRTLSSKVSNLERSLALVMDMLKRGTSIKVSEDSPTMSTAPDKANTNIADELIPPLDYSGTEPTYVATSDDALNPENIDTIQSKAMEDAQYKAAFYSSTITDLVSFLKGGNIWVTAGVIFVILSLTFTYGYISSIYDIPAAFKVSAGLLVGAVLFFIGWRLRIQRRAFALILQGGAIGAIYLSLFAAAKVYKILPIPVVLVAITFVILASGIIAVVQNSQVMAIFAAAIGYAAPILLSTKSGNYVGLFSYYALLTFGVTAISSKRYWRYLNSMSFALVFGVFTYWYIDRFAIEYLRNTEVFLIIFALQFTAINVFSTLRHNDKIENAFAVTTSFVYMSLQLSLLEHTEYGQSIAAFTLGIFYITLSFLLGKKLRSKISSLITLYLSLGIIFVNLALPLALEGNWIPAIWAVEGAVLVILGFKQSNMFFRVFGLILVALANIVAIKNASQYSWDYTDHRVILSITWFCQIISAAAIFVSAFAYKIYSKKSLGDIVGIVAFWLGFLFWSVAFTAKISEFFTVNAALVMTLSFTALILTLLGRYYKWKMAQLIAYLPTIYVMHIFLAWFVYGGNIFLTMGHLQLDYIINPKVYGTVIAMFLYVATQWYLVYLISKDRCDVNGCIVESAVSGNLLERKAFCIHIGWQSLLTAITVIFISSMAAQSFRLDISIGLMVMSVLVWAILQPRFYAISIVNKYPIAYARWGAGLIVIISLLQLLLFGRNTFNPAIINALQPTEIGVLAASVYWFVYNKYLSEFRLSGKLSKGMGAFIAVVIFIWIHYLLGRVLCLMDGGYYSFSSLFRSPSYQLAVAILWGGVGFGVMIFSQKKMERAYWFTGAILLAADALKLMLIDLSRAGTIPRIASFMAVGVLLIVIGYFVPLPPANKENIK